MGMLDQAAQAAGQDPAAMQQPAQQQPMLPEDPAMAQTPEEELVPMEGDQEPGEPAADPAEQSNTFEEEASAEEQQAYEEAMEELKVVLYQNKKASDALVKMISPEDLVQTTSKTVIQLIAQMDEKVNLDESVVYTVTEEAVDRLSELVETSQGVTYSEKDIQKIMMTSWEAIMGIFGGDQEMAPVYQDMVAGADDNMIKQAQQKYVEMQNG